MTINEVLDLQAVPGETDWPSDYSDFEKLFWKIKGLRLDQQRKESFWSATNENLKKAYDQLEHQEQELERAYSQIQRYLENIREGLLLIDTEFVIQGQYSEYLHELFNTKNLEGKNLVEFLFPDEAQASDREELQGFLDILFSSKNASNQMINDVNPLVGKTISVGEHQRELKTVDAKFTRIVSDDRVEAVMITIVDRTHEAAIERKLELEESRHESELETISAILKNGPAALLDFIDESSALVDALKQNWSRLEDDDLRTRLFKQVHSLKGVSKYFELNRVSSLAHELEDLISSTETDNSASRGDFYRIIEQLENGVAGIKALNEKLLQFSDTVGDRSEESPTTRFLQTLKGMVAGLGEELEKQVGVTIKTDGSEIPHLSQMQKPLIHLARNSVDHGIEDPYQRLSAQKPMRGTVTVKSFRSESAYVIDVIDDGAGIDFDAIRVRAVDLGILGPTSSPSQADLLRIIFSPRFSSHDESTEISGRGLGLDIVMDTLKELGGKVAVKTSQGKGTRFRLTLPL